MKVFPETRTKLAKYVSITLPRVRPYPQFFEYSTQEYPITKNDAKTAPGVKVFTILII